MGKSYFSRLILSINTRVPGSSLEHVQHTLCTLFSCTRSIMTHLSSAKLGGRVFAVGLTVPERLPVPNDFIMGVVARVWNMCQLQCDVCSTEEVTQWRVCFTPMNSALFGTAQHRTGLDWTGLDRHCCHCNGAVLLSTSNYPKIALTFQGRKSSQFLASVLKCKKKRRAYVFVGTQLVLGIVLSYVTKSSCALVM